MGLGSGSLEQTPEERGLHPSHATLPTHTRPAWGSPCHLPTEGHHPLPVKAGGGGKAKWGSVGLGPLGTQTLPGGSSRSGPHQS